MRAEIKAEHHLVSPRNPQAEGHSVTQTSWPRLGPQPGHSLTEERPKELACLDLEAPNSTGPKELLSGGCPQPTSCPTGWQQIPCSCKQPVPPHRGQRRGGFQAGSRSWHKARGLTPSTACLWQALALRAGQELAPSQSNFNTSYLGSPERWAASPPMAGGVAE